MKIAFRCDTSVQIGTGHFSRCYQLAKVLKERGHYVIFLSKDLPKHYREILDKDQILIQDLSESTKLDDEVHFLKNFFILKQVDFLVVDSYAIDQTWEKQVRVPGLKILAIDDLHNRQHDCDYLLDQNILKDDDHDPYKNLVPGKTQKLYGPKYCLINPKFTLDGRKKRFEFPLRVLIFFGGMDHVGATLKYLETFKIIAKNHPVTIVVGLANPNLEKIKKNLENTTISLKIQLPDLYDAMLRSDIFIGAGGVITWERCAMGLPSIIVSIAKNQEDIALSLSRKAVHQYLGPHEKISNNVLLAEFEHLTSSNELLANFSQNSLKLVPRSGINNVVEALGF